jgi:hypothetical protein
MEFDGLETPLRVGDGIEDKGIFILNDWFLPVSSTRSRIKTVL